MEGEDEDDAWKARMKKILQWKARMKKILQSREEMQIERCNLT